MFNVKYIFFISIFFITIFIFMKNMGMSLVQTNKSTKVMTNNIEKSIHIENEKKKKQTFSQNKMDESIKEEKVIDAVHFLGQTRDLHGRYEIKLRTLRLIPQKPSFDTVFAIPFVGTLEHDSVITQFAISLSEEYMNYTEYIFFDVKDNFTGKINSCSLDFLGELEQNINYFVKFNYYDDELICILTKSEKMSSAVLKMKEKMSKPMKLEDLPKDLQKKLLNKV